MESYTKLKKIGSLNAVKHFLIVDKTGNIMSHNFSNPDSIASMVLKCAKNLEIEGKDNFQYQFFLFNDDTFLIFPVGKQYLGVIKERKTSTAVFVKNILKILKNL